MRIGVLGTGMVGRAFADKLVEVGHEVRIGSRSAGNEAAMGWARSAGSRGQAGTFAEAAAFGELVVNATRGMASVDAITAAGESNLEGKVLLDVANPLDTSKGTPTLAFCNTDSLGERLQRSFPAARVVKGFNTMNCELMVNPSRLAERHSLPICGDDDDAKNQVRALAQSFGWPQEDVLDLGGIRAARGLEMYFGLWIAVYEATGDLLCNIRLVRSSEGRFAGSN